MKKILILSAERLGDTLFLTPSLAFIKLHAADVLVDMIAITPLAGAVLKNNPNIHQLLVSPDEEMLKTIADNYDAILIPHLSNKAKHYASKFTAKVIENPYSHQIMPTAEKAIRFVAEVLDVQWDHQPIPYELFPAVEEDNHVKKALADNEVDVTENRIVAIHLGCHGLAKKHSSWFKKSRHEKVWPLKNFIELGKKLLLAYPDVSIVLTGSKAEEGLAKKFLKKVPSAISLVNQTNILQLAALLKQAKLFICSDTGALHVACAMNTNLIGLYGPTDISQTGPYPPSEHFVVLENADLTQLSVDTVLGAVNNFL